MPNLKPKHPAMLVADYAELERRLAPGNGSAVLLDAHRAYAAELFGVPYSEVTPAQRRKAKARRYWEAYSG